MPDFGEIDVSKLQITRHTAEVTEADVDRMVENLRQQRRSWTVVGTLPGRKPLMRAVRAISRRRPPTWESTSPAGTRNVIRRSRLPVDSTETCVEPAITHSVRPRPRRGAD
jgi:hypothetical protein